MNIRTKITLLQLSTILFVGLSLFLLSRSYTDTRDFKSLQVRFNSIVDKETLLESKLDELLYSELHITVTAQEIIDIYEALIRDLDNLKNDLSRSNENFFKKYKLFYHEWFLLNADYYSPINNYIRRILIPEEGLIKLIANNGLVKTLDLMGREDFKGDVRDYHEIVLNSTINLVHDHKNSTEKIFLLLDDLQDSIQYEMQKNVATNYLYLIMLLIAIILFSTTISSTLTKSIIKKIHNVESSFIKISEGDLTTEIVDKSGDEFSKLADNFNILNSMLMNKSTSMRDIMNEIGDIISESIQIDTLMVKITQIAKESTNADAAAILLVDKFSDILRVEHVEGFFPPPYSISVSVQQKRELIEEKFKSTPIKFKSNYLSRESVLKGNPFFVKDTELDKGIIPLNSNPQDILFVKSTITIPLVVSNKLLGVLSLVKTNRDEIFSDLDYTNMVSFVEYVSLTIDNLYKYMELLEKSELQREIGIASEIQTQLLPKKIPTVLNADIAAFSNSARGISGDYYDIYKVSPTKSVATVCDVAGKGIPAALVLVIIRTILHLASNSRASARDLLTFLNKSISDRVQIDYFATLSVMIYDSETNILTLSIAGDTPILVYRRSSNSVEKIYHNDLPIGIDKTTTYKNLDVKLAEDDVLYMFSDGLLEVRNDFNDIFSIEELESFILEYSNNRTETISVKLQEYLNEFRGSQERMDDETVIIFKSI